MKNDLRNGAITEFLSDDPEKVDQDLREVLTSGLFTWQDKEYISRWLRDGEGNTRIAQRLSELYSGRVETTALSLPALRLRFWTMTKESWQPWHIAGVNSHRFCGDCM